MLNRRTWVILGWLLIATVVYFSLTPKPPSAGLTFGDKIGHLSAYAGLMFWWYPIQSNAHRLALIFVLMGLTLEILQSLSGYRQGDLFDLAANTAGIGIGWGAARIATHYLSAWFARNLAV